MPDLLERLTSALADRYAIESEIGRGGMAAVFLAEDLRHHRKVAIKVMHPEISSDVATERFFREIEIVAGLTHPHILPLHDSGEADGLLYCVMPYIQGESLSEYLQCEKQLGVEEAVRIATEVAEALGYAHERGIIHRDIKPANILLEEGHAVVADFGIARAVEEAGGARITQTGVAVGTPAYMSPEQGTGAVDLDGRTDVYALGCVLYEMLAGDPPYTGVTPLALIKRHSLDPVPSVRTVREAVPESVEYAITKAMAKVPADRFKTAGEFVAALTAPAPRVAARRSGRRVAVALVGVVAVLAVGFVAGREVFGPGSTEAVTVVLAEPTVGPEDPVLGQVVRTGLEMALLASPQISAIIPRELRQALEAMGREPNAVLDEATALEVAARTGAAGVVAADLRRLGTGSLVVTASVVAPNGETRAIVRRQAAGDDALLPVLDTLSLDLRRELGEGEQTLEESKSLLYLLTPSTEAARYYQQAQNLVKEGDERQAMVLLDQAVAIDPDFAMAWGFLAALRQNWFGDHLEAMEKSYGLSERMLPHQRQLVEAAAAALLFRDYQTAATLHRAAIDQPTADLRGDPEYPETQYNFMTLGYLELGQPWRADETMVELYRAIEEGRATAAPTVDDLNHGIAKAQLGDSTAAEHYRQRNAELSGQEFAWFGDYFIAVAAGQWATAATALRDAEAAWADPLSRFMAGVMLGTVEAARGRPQASEDAFSIALEAAAELGNPFLDVQARLHQADAEFFALGNPTRASELMAEILVGRSPEKGLARRYHAHSQALAAAICATPVVSLSHVDRTQLQCGAEIVTDSLRDTIETLEALGWTAYGEGRFETAVRAGAEPILARAGGPGLRAQAPAAAAYETLSKPDSAIDIYTAMARASFGWVSNAPSALSMRSYALRKLASLGGEVGDSATAVLRADWADAEPEFLARIAAPLIGAQ